MSKTRHPSAGKSRQEHSSAVTAQLLDAAEALYSEDGPQALTNRRISSRAGTTIQPIYSFFGSHDNLVDGLYVRCIESLREFLDNSTSSTGVSRDLPRTYRSYCLQYPGRFRFARTGGSGTSQEDVAAGIRDELATAFSTLSDDAPQGDGRAAMAAINGFVLAEIEGLLPAEADREALFTDLIRRLFP